MKGVKIVSMKEKPVEVLVERICKIPKKDAKRLFEGKTPTEYFREIRERCS